MISMEIHAKQFLGSLDFYLSVLPEELREKAMRRQMRILVERMADWTPPHRGRGGSTPADMARGEAAIQRQMKRIIMAVDAATLETMQETHGNRARTLHLKSGKFPNVEITDSPNAIRRVHQANRDWRGRVPKGRQLQAVTSHRTLDAEIKRASAQVGLAKAGWLPAFAHLGGMSPAWIARHGRGQGTFQDKMSATEISFSATNFAKSIGSLAPRIVSATLRSRSKAMLHELERAAKSAQARAKLGGAIAAS